MMLCGVTGATSSVFRRFCATRRALIGFFSALLQKDHATECPFLADCAPFDHCLTLVLRGDEPCFIERNPHRRCVVGDLAARKRYGSRPRPNPAIVTIPALGLAKRTGALAVWQMSQRSCILMFKVRIDPYIDQIGPRTVVMPLRRISEKRIVNVIRCAERAQIAPSSVFRRPQ